MTEAVDDSISVGAIAEADSRNADSRDALERHTLAANRRSATQFLQAVDARRGMNHLRHHVENRKYRSLDLPHQLQEGRQHADRDCPVAKTEAAPHEGEKVAEPESGAQREPRNGREPRPFQHLRF